LEGVCFPGSSAVGASPSGKAVDFDSTMRRFESSRPSQAVTQLKMVCNQVAERLPNKGFLALFAMSPGAKK
jgi:hypothetical protein